MQATDSHFWARFRTEGGQRLRFDTRIYLQPRCRPDAGDKALGCIIGKNPGSAGPVRAGRSLVPIALDGDKFLPTVLSILRQAYRRKGRELPSDAYVQVLNLFYLCDRDLQTAKRALKGRQRRSHCAAERRGYPWAWFAWGGADATLDPLKLRFETLAAGHRFFYDGRRQTVIERPPAVHELAKHTQGMPQAGIVQFLAESIV